MKASSLKEEAFLLSEGFRGKLLASSKKFDKKHIGDVMEYLFGAQALYFDTLETHYLVVEALKETGICLYSCGHMG